MFEVGTAYELRLLQSGKEQIVLGIVEKYTRWSHYRTS